MDGGFPDAGVGFERETFGSLAVRHRSCAGRDVQLNGHAVDIETQPIEGYGAQGSPHPLHELYAANN